MMLNPLNKEYAQLKIISIDTRALGKLKNVPVVKHLHNRNYLLVFLLMRLSGELLIHQEHHLSL